MAQIHGYVKLRRKMGHRPHCRHQTAVNHERGLLKCNAFREAFIKVDGTFA
jgi:hypothetical protein